MSSSLPRRIHRRLRRFLPRIRGLAIGVLGPWALAPPGAPAQPPRAAPKPAHTSVAAATTWEADVDPLHGATCLSCHPVEEAGTTLKHVPFLEGRCLSCHVGHDDSAPNLLVGDVQTKCLACHTGLEMAAEGAKLQHPPTAPGVAAASCTDCHDPHESLLRNRLRDEERFLSCSECHADFLEASSELPHHHEFFNPKTDCGSCHYAHQRSDATYLRENVSESCLTCHDLAIQVEGRKLENVGRVLRESRFVHQAGDSEGGHAAPSCPTCHTPHGSVQPSLLSDDYPAGTYASYAPEQYALCWKCHNVGLVESKTGFGITRFRNGTENLHRKHVAELKRGRACHICHSPHAGDNEHLLREEIRFKGWTSSFEFEELPDGGTCTTACHRTKEYHR